MGRLTGHWCSSLYCAAVFCAMRVGSAVAVVQAYRRAVLTMETTTTTALMHDLPVGSSRSASVNPSPHTVSFSPFSAVNAPDWLERPRVGLHGDLTGWSSGWVAVPETSWGHGLHSPSSHYSYSRLSSSSVTRYPNGSWQEVTIVIDTTQLSPDTSCMLAAIMLHPLQLGGIVLMLMF